MNAREWLESKSAKQDWRGRGLLPRSQDRPAITYASIAIYRWHREGMAAPPWFGLDCLCPTCQKVREAAANA